MVAALQPFCDPFIFCPGAGFCDQWKAELPHLLQHVEYMGWYSSMSAHAWIPGGKNNAWLFPRRFRTTDMSGGSASSFNSVSVHIICESVHWCISVLVSGVTGSPRLCSHYTGQACVGENWQGSPAGQSPFHRTDKSDTLLLNTFCISTFEVYRTEMSRDVPLLVE